ncbi:two-component sensor histidine kinase [Streptomyces spiroverticillatus]|uniref:histidine kinase n=1 Tax=Streptomyces finlayi TaxID=67296 RepID=A0A918WUY9_9ACTN|nr:histidine kinase [Streptomyces finlayi]GHA01504.1 two-component sensor histidine kinase [Streptomyces spiroverticillatus]GHC85898.1 two-component sensor histidine kinase [Streptomyces finlayi]
MSEQEYRWLLPSAMGGPELSGTGTDSGTDPGAGARTARRPRRTLRDWIVDVLMFVLAAFFGMAAVEEMAGHAESEVVLALDQLAGALACCALWLRRRWPTGVAVGLVLLSIGAPLASGAMIAALFGVTVHRPFKVAGPVAAAALASGLLQSWLRPEPGTSFKLALVLTVVITLLVVGWGMFVRARRQLVLSLRERTVRAEAEAALRAEQAQRLAREAIAREMHDVLAHRLTLLSVHAGALEFRPDAPPAQVARAAGVIRDSAHEALQDLREIIGVLRSPGTGDEDRPQPTLATLDALVAESRQAGAKVTLDNRIADPGAVPAAVGRTVYRIAQEALTNARKHAPGAEVTVTVTGRPGDGITVTLHNPAPEGDVPKVPGSGQGLIGLTERAQLAGGRLDHGPEPDGGFRITAWLPWAP